MKTLRPCKHKKLEFFIADDVEVCTFRDEIMSMEHPFFALKTGDSKTREYKNGCVTMTIKSLAGLGLSTIFDKDIWIYAISKLQEAINNNQNTNRTVAFTPYNFFVTTNRDKGGKSYKELEKSLSRLSGTRIKTNIVYSENLQETEEFGLIDRWKILEDKKGRLDIGMVEVTLPDWLYQAIKQTKVLKISPDYFRIRKAMHRRLYEIARKHCGSQNEFVIQLDKLHVKTGSFRELRKFKFDLRQLEKINDLPDYKIFYDCKTDNVIFYNRIKNSKELKNIWGNHRIKKKLRDINQISKPDKQTPRGFRG